jgi:hypothetical protein
MIGPCLGFQPKGSTLLYIVQGFMFVAKWQNNVQVILDVVDTGLINQV